MELEGKNSAEGGDVQQCKIVVSVYRVAMSSCCTLPYSDTEIVVGNYSNGDLEKID